MVERRELEEEITVSTAEADRLPRSLVEGQWQAEEGKQGMSYFYLM